MFQPFMVPMRVLMLLGGGLLAVFGSEAIELGGAGPLAVVAAAFVSCYFWQTQGWEVDDVSTFTYLQGKFSKRCVASNRALFFKYARCSKTCRSKFLSTFCIFRGTQRNFVFIHVCSIFLFCAPLPLCPFVYS